MIRNVKNILNHREIEDLKKIIMLEKQDSIKYKQAIDKVYYAIKEDGPLDSEDEELEWIMENEPEGSDKLNRATARIQMNIDLLNLQLCIDWKNGIESEKKLLRLLGFSKDHSDIYIEYYNHFKNKHGEDWFNWLKYYKDYDGDDNEEEMHYRQMLALQELSKEDNDWNKVYEYIIQKASLLKEKNLLQTTYDYLSEIKPAMDNFKIENYMGAYNSLIEISNTMNPYRLIYVGVLKYYLGYAKELKYISEEIKKGIQILRDISQDNNDFYKQFKNVINDLHKVFVKYLSDNAEKNVDNLNRKMLSELDKKMIEICHFEIWMSLEALSYIDNKEKMKTVYLQEIARWSDDYKVLLNKVKQVSSYPSLMEECNKFAKFGNDKEYYITSADYMPLEMISIDRQNYEQEQIITFHDDKVCSICGGKLILHNGQVQCEVCGYTSINNSNEEYKLDPEIIALFESAMSKFEAGNYPQAYYGFSYILEKNPNYVLADIYKELSNYLKDIVNNITDIFGVEYIKDTLTIFLDEIPSRDIEKLHNQSPSENDFLDKSIQILKNIRVCFDQLADLCISATKSSVEEEALMLNISYEYYDDISQGTGLQGVYHQDLALGIASGNSFLTGAGVGGLATDAILNSISRRKAANEVKKSEAEFKNLVAQYEMILEKTILTLNCYELYLMLVILGSIKNKEKINTKNLRKITDWAIDYKVRLDQIKNIENYPALLYQHSLVDRFCKEKQFVVPQIFNNYNFDFVLNNNLEKTDNNPVNHSYNNSNTIVEQKPFSGIALAGMILGISSCVLSCFYGAGIINGIVGVVLSIISLKKPCRNNNMSKTGLITSIIGTVLSVLIVILYIFFEIIMDYYN